MRAAKPAFKAAIWLLAGIVIVGCASWPIARRMREVSFQAPPGMEALAVASAPLPLKPDDPDATRVGELVYRGGLHLTSPDKRFGGFSGLIVAADGRRLLAISDRAYWLTADIGYAGGTLASVTAARFGPLLDGDGAPLASPHFDSEGLTVDAGDPFDPSTDGSVLVSFETRDRVDSYGFARDGAKALPEPVPMPEAIKDLVGNKGLEGIVRLTDGRLLAIAERSLDAAGNALGWIVAQDGSGAAVTYRRDDPYQVTDLARGPDGTIYALERRFSQMAGPGMRIRRIDPATIEDGALLDGPAIVEIDVTLTVDNMEALSVIRGPSGETLFFVMSDNNLNRVQRTLLLLFALHD